MFEKLFEAPREVIRTRLLSSTKQYECGWIFAEMKSDTTEVPMHIHQTRLPFRYYFRARGYHAGDHYILNYPI